MTTIKPQIVAKRGKLRIPASAKGIAVEPRRVEDMLFATLASDAEISLCVD